MSRHLDVEVWILLVLAAGAGVFSAWFADAHQVAENTAKMATYTVLLFACLVMALRSAWRKLRLWVDLLVLLMLHAALVLPLVHFLNSHSIRLNWVLALPFLTVELSLLLGFLWRRNVRHSSS